MNVTPYTGPTTTYTGLTHTATYTITGVNGETGATVGTVDVTDTIHTHVGIYNGDQWSFTGANYNDQSGTVDDCIAKADATVDVTPYNVTFRSSRVGRCVSRRRILLEVREGRDTFTNT